MEHYRLGEIALNLKSFGTTLYTPEAYILSIKYVDNYNYYIFIKFIFVSRFFPMYNQKYKNADYFKQKMLF